MILQDSPMIGLNKNILKSITSYEDFISYFLELEQSSMAVSWIKADLFIAFVEKFGQASIAALAKDIKQPASTIVSYIRTARAFDPEKRFPEISFSHYFQASFADSYENGEFTGEKRYELIGRAIDEKMSTRQVAREAKQTKEENPEKKEAERKLYRIIATVRNMFKEEKYKEINSLYKQIVE